MSDASRVEILKHLYVKWQAIGRRETEQFRSNESISDRVGFDRKFSWVQGVLASQRRTPKQDYHFKSGKDIIERRRYLRTV